MSANHSLELVNSPVGWTAVAVFVVAYCFVVMEERLHLRKSKPVMIGAAIIWSLIGWYSSGNPELSADFAATAFRPAFTQVAGSFFCPGWIATGCGLPRPSGKPGPGFGFQ